jgi:hypothetical protein
MLFLLFSVRNEATQEEARAFLGDDTQPSTRACVHFVFFVFVCLRFMFCKMSAFASWFMFLKNLRTPGGGKKIQVSLASQRIKWATCAKSTSIFKHHPQPMLMITGSRGCLHTTCSKGSFQNQQKTLPSQRPDSGEPHFFVQLNIHCQSLVMQKFPGVYGFVRRINTQQVVVVAFHDSKQVLMDLLAEIRRMCVSSI